MNDEYAWITNHCENHPKRVSLTVGHLLPDLFQHYFIIQFNYGLLEGFPFDPNPGSPDSEREQDRRWELEKQFIKQIKTSFDVFNMYTPVSLKELALKFQLPYHWEMMDHIRSSHGLIQLRDKTMDMIVKLLSLLMNKGPLSLFMDDYGRNYKGEIKTTTTPEEYIELQELTGLDACSYLFQTGHRWCLATFEDSSYFIFGSDNHNAEFLKDVEGLEYFEVTRDIEL